MRTSSAHQGCPVIDRALWAPDFSTHQGCPATTMAQQGPIGPHRSFGALGPYIGHDIGPLYRTRIVIKFMCHAFQLVLSSMYEYRAGPRIPLNKHRREKKKDNA